MDKRHLHVTWENAIMTECTDSHNSLVECLTLDY